MILELDIGNTRAKWRLLQADNTQKQDDNIEKCGILSDYQWETFEPFLEHISKIRYSSVAEKGFADYIMGHQLFQSAQISQAKTTQFCAGVKNSYEDPSRMGVDRWLAMVAAFNINKKACCVIDCGSAVTVDYVSDDGEHIGGYIVAGVQMLENALLNNTSKIIVDEGVHELGVDWGTSTEQAIKHGKISMLTTWLNHLTKKCLSKAEDIYITGGDALLIKEYLDDDIQYCESLVFDGLAYVCDV